MPQPRARARSPRSGQPAAAPERPPILGLEQPRLWTPPARRLTRTTSRGYELADFAEKVLGEPLLPWQRWLAIHALELDRSGGYRYRTVLVLVGRQNGKTHFLRVLALWRLYLDGARLVLSVAQSLDIAREAWRAGCESVTDIPDLVAELDRISRVNGDEHLALTGGRRWKIAAANRRGGRGLSVDLLVLDELREQRDWDAWSALSKTTMARSDGMTFGISNAGDDESVVLNHLREAALAEQDPTLAVFEWSAPDGCELDDPHAWQQANPGLGYTVSEQAIRSALSTDPAPVFRTEVLCQRVDSLADAAVTAEAWTACTDPALTLDGLRDRIVACIDISPDLAHATLVAAAIDTNNRVRIEAIASWTDTATMLGDLPSWIERIQPRQLGWFSSGPAAALKADLEHLGGEGMGGTEAIAACQALAEHVQARRLLHAGDPLLTAHIVGAKRLPSGDGWRFVRRGAGHVDAAYAAAGAVHLARSLPEPVTPRVRWLAG
jgi:phage terminase large subunit-like protein